MNTHDTLSRSGVAEQLLYTLCRQKFLTAYTEQSTEQAFIQALGQCETPKALLDKIECDKTLAALPPHLKSLVYERLLTLDPSPIHRRNYAYHLLFFGTAEEQHKAYLWLRQVL
ncbi:hypothetical protein [Eisenibacter elegans]|jgi:hypothetical protein|uniref:hypothetical protein n=1 Tax=Eisenibacter elegans TaxID=997 RepID=UPI00041926C7|nr:hypothetical protein [Eisenibacter elegans]